MFRGVALRHEPYLMTVSSVGSGHYASFPRSGRLHEFVCKLFCFCLLVARLWSKRGRHFAAGIPMNCRQPSCLLCRDAKPWISRVSKGRLHTTAPFPPLSHFRSLLTVRTCCKSSPAWALAAATQSRQFDLPGKCPTCDMRQPATTKPPKTSVPLNLTTSYVRMAASLAISQYCPGLQDISLVIFHHLKPCRI